MDIADVDCLIHAFLLLLIITSSPIAASSEQDGKKDLVQPNEKHLEGVPHFRQQPLAVYYVNKSAPAIIQCEAEPVSHVNIFCAEKQFSYMSQPVSESGLRVQRLTLLGLPDPEHGRRWRFSLEVHLRDVVEWFSEYKCYCEAWNQIIAINKVKKVHSSVALIQESYFQSSFKHPPQNQTVAEGQRLKLVCVPPDAKPNADISWLKNDQLVSQHKKDGSTGIIIDKSNQLIIDQVRKSDSGSYTCQAQSLGVTKRADPATVTVTDKYFWSDWSEWQKCPPNCLDPNQCNKLTCKDFQRRKIRFCIYRNSKTDKVNCQGRDDQYEQCDIFCSRESKVQWRKWSEWTIWCEPNCVEKRTRACEHCIRVDRESRNCSAELCTNKERKSTLRLERSTMYLGLFITIAVLFVIILVILCLVTRKGYIHLIPRRTIAFATQSNGVKKMYGPKFSNCNNEKLLLSGSDASPLPVVTIKNHNVAAATTSANGGSSLNSNVGNSIMGMTSKTLRPTEDNCFMNPSIGTNNANNNYSPVYEVHSHSDRFDQVMPAIYSEYPLMGQSPLTSVSPFHHQPPPPPHLSPNKLALLSSMSASIEASPINRRSSGQQQQSDCDSRPPSALYQELSIGRARSGSLVSSNCPQPPLSEPEINCTVWAQITGSGGRVALPQSGVSLLIPQGLLQPSSSSEEMFLAVCRDPSSLPVLDAKETLLSPVVMCGPSHLQINKAAVVSLPHCINMVPGNEGSSWNIRLLCARFQNSQIPPLWQELATVRPLSRADPHTFVQLDPSLAHVLLDRQLPQMLCLTGRVGDSGNDCSIRLRVLAFTEADLAATMPQAAPLEAGAISPPAVVVVRVHLVPDTREAAHNVVVRENRAGRVLLDGSCKVNLSGRGGDLALNVAEVSSGWRCRSGSKIQNFSLGCLWRLDHIGSAEALILLEPTPDQRPALVGAPAVSCRVTLHQTDPSCLTSVTATGNITQSAHVSLYLHTELSSSASISPRGQAMPLLDDLGLVALRDTQQQQAVFKLSNQTRQNLRHVLDPLWQTLANHLGLNGNLVFFGDRPNPSDSILDLWEARSRDETALLDLVSVMRVIGRGDCAAILESDVPPHK